MEIITLDSDNQPKDLVENYTSAIWTERYSSAGDFQIQSADIAGLMEALPRETWISLRESTVPMRVENYKIEKKPQEAPLLTVTGRSGETILERRAASGTVPTGTNVRAPWIITAGKESDAAYKAIRMIIGDFERYQGTPPVQVLSAVSPILSLNDAFPDIDLPLPADYSTSTANSYEIPAKDLYNAVLDLLQVNHHGIKAVRPAPGDLSIGIEIYNGAILDNLVFDARFDQFDSATYLLSDQGSANVGYLYGPAGASTVLKNVTEPTNYERRVLMVDLTGEPTATNATLPSRGLIELYKNNATVLFDGQISVQIGDLYNKPNGYFLGDILRLDGEYAISETVRVEEFIRSSDSSGEKAYPTFSKIDDSE